MLVLTHSACTTRTFPRCRCAAWTARLIKHGFFPTKPNKPRVAISIDLLEMFQCFATGGGFSKLCFANGMREFHRMRMRREPLRRYDEMFRATVPFYLRVRRERDDQVFRTLNRHFETLVVTAATTSAPASTTVQEVDTALAGPGTVSSTAPGAATVNRPIGITPEDILMSDSPVFDPNRSSVREVNPIPEPAPQSEPASSTSPPPANMDEHPLAIGPSKPKPLRLKVGALSALCPACFHRTTSEDRSPLSIGIDGNMQQFRYGHVGKHNTDVYDTPMFYHVEYGLRTNKAEDEKNPNVAGTICEHNFKAIMKPNTMKFKDETGLLMMVCR